MQSGGEGDGGEKPTAASYLCSEGAEHSLHDMLKRIYRIQCDHFNNYNSQGSNKPRKQLNRYTGILHLPLTCTCIQSKVPPPFLT